MCVLASSTAKSNHNILAVEDLDIRQYKPLILQTRELGYGEVKWPTQGLPAGLWQSTGRESLTRAFIFSNSLWPRWMLRSEEGALTWNADPGSLPVNSKQSSKVVRALNLALLWDQLSGNPDRKLTTIGMRGQWQKVSDFFFVCVLFLLRVLGIFLADSSQQGKNKKQTTHSYV